MGQLAQTSTLADISSSRLRFVSDGPQPAGFKRDIAKIASQIIELSDRLLNLGSEVQTLPVTPGAMYASAPSAAGSAASHASLLLNIIKGRRARADFFSAELFADPAWDILLDLYRADLRQCRVSTTSACIAAAVPATTGLRWLTLMSEKGLIIRRPDPLDGRRVYVELSNESRVQMEAYFGTLQSDPLPVL